MSPEGDESRMQERQESTGEASGRSSPKQQTKTGGIGRLEQEKKRRISDLSVDPGLIVEGKRVRFYLKPNQKSVQ